MESQRREGRVIAIPEDVVILIFRRLPLEFLHKLKALSKSWSSLILLVIRPPPLLLGLFYNTPASRFPPTINIPSVSFSYVDFAGIHNSSVDPTLSFLPCSYRNIRVLDSCNGLLLCRCFSGNYSTFVCNPLTKSWTEFPIQPLHTRLDFDPQVSPHFKMVTLLKDFNGLRVFIYSSEAQRWSSCEFISYDHRYRYMMNIVLHLAYWKGCLYFGDSLKILRFHLVEGEGQGERHDVDCEPTEVEFPAETEKPGGVCLARSRDKLFLAGYNSFNNHGKEELLRVRVWSLSNRDQIVWVLDHDREVPYDLLRGHGLANIVGFHPFLDVVYIQRGNTLHAFDLMKQSLVEVCPIELESWKLCPASIYPFSPCVVDSLEHRIRA